MSVHQETTADATPMRRTPRNPSQMTRADRVRARADLERHQLYPIERVARSFFMTTIEDDTVIDAQVSVGSWGPISYEGSGNRIRKVRVVVADSLVFEFLEFKVEVAELLWEDCDAESNELNDIACTIAQAWDVDEFQYDVCDCGNPVVLTHVWVSPAHPHTPWQTIVEDVVERITPKYSVLLLKAFPLEYCGEGTQKTFKRRHAAMKRHYSRRLGVSSIPGKIGDSGWMYRFRPALQSFMPKPKTPRKPRSLYGR